MSGGDSELSAADLAVDHRLALLSQSFRFLLEVTPVDADDLVPHPDVEAEPGAQGLRGLQQQRGALLDDAAHVVGQAAVGEGHVAAALVHRDLGVLQQAAQTGGRGHSAGDAAHDDDSHAVMLPAPLRPPRGPPAPARPVS